MRSVESSIQRTPDTKICVVQRISDGTNECKGDGNRRKSETVEKECRTSGGQTNMTDHRSLQIRSQGEAVCTQFFVQQEASGECEGREIYDQT